MRLSEAWIFYESEKRLDGYSHHTLKAYSIQIKLLIEEFGDIEISEIELTGLKKYLSKQTQLKPASLGHRIRFTKSFFRFLHEEALIQLNPAARLREPKQGMRIPKALSEENVEMLRIAASLPVEQVIVELIFSTGCRVGEVYRLDRKDINWDARSAVVLGKGNKEREVYFNMRAEIWLKKYLQSRTDNDPALIVTERKFLDEETNERKPHRMSIDQIRWVLKRIAKRAQIDSNVYPHKLRHSYATHLLNNGAPMEAIQEFLGHQKIEVTKLYAMLSSERKREIYRKYF